MDSLEGKNKHDYLHSRYRPPLKNNDVDVDTNLTTATTSTNFVSTWDEEVHEYSSNDTSGEVSDCDTIGNNDSDEDYSDLFDIAHNYRLDNDERRSILIDNSTLQYAPIRLENSGVICMCRPDVIQHPSFLCIVGILDDDVMSCLNILPQSVHNLLLRTKLWINLGPHYIYGRIDQPTIAQHTTTHHHTDWLVCHNDNPMKCHGIEFYNVLDYCFRMRYHWNCCGGLLLHEYCHIIHQVVLSLENEPIRRLYKAAKASRKYMKVIRRDWADRQNPTDLAYSMVNCKEFFAEFSVTYLSRGYRTLDTAIYDDVLAASPVILEPLLLHRLAVVKQEKLTQNIADNDEVQAIITHQHHQFQYSYLTSGATLRHLDGHCNKFYPFTSGQFRYYDRNLYDAFDYIWTNIVATWIDTNDEGRMEPTHLNLNVNDVKERNNYHINNTHDDNVMNSSDHNDPTQTPYRTKNSNSDIENRCECCSAWFSTALRLRRDPTLEIIDMGVVPESFIPAESDDDDDDAFEFKDDVYDVNYFVTMRPLTEERSTGLVSTNTHHQSQMMNLTSQHFKNDLIRPLLEKREQLTLFPNSYEMSVLDTDNYKPIISDTIDL